MSAPVYLDYNATTPCDPLVIQEMLPYLGEKFGNPDSRTHLYGWLASDALEDSRQRLANCLGVHADDLFFTSGATEALNAALLGLVHKEGETRGHIITCVTEHKAVLAPCEYLEQQGVRVTYLEVDGQGMINMDSLKNSITEDTLFMALMHANNETGVIHPVKEMGELAKSRGVYFISDLSQALGKIPLDDFSELGIDIACFSSHKVYGPKGVGALYVKDGRGKNALPGLIKGGGQERGFRSGTVNVPGVVGFVKAVELACESVSKESERIKKLRDHLETSLLKIEETTGNGFHAHRLPHVSNISFGYLDGETLLRALSKELAVSNGSACNSIGVNSSYVLQAMGVEKSLAAASLRLSLGRYTTSEEIEVASSVIHREVARLREDNILWERRKKTVRH